MIYPISIAITFIIALIGGFGGFDTTTTSNHGMIKTGLDFGPWIITAASAVWSTVGIAIFAIISNEYAEKIATMENSKAFIEPAEQRLAGLKDHYENMLPKFKDLPQEILANEDSPMSSAITAISTAEADLEEARNKFTKAKIKVEGYKNSPVAIIYNRNPPTYN